MELQLLRGDEVVYVRPVGTERAPPDRGLVRREEAPGDPARLGQVTLQ